MANVKISQLPVTTSPQASGLVPIVQDGTTYSTTPTSLKTLLEAGVSSFNTRTGDVTLESSDVTDALGFTPADETTTLTINGVTQDLSTNRTWTIGGNTIDLQSAGAITAGDAVVINDSGNVSSVVSAFINPSSNANFPGGTGVSVSSSSIKPRRVVSPHDPNMSVFVWDDASYNYLYISLGVGVEGTGSAITSAGNGSGTVVSSSYSSYDVQWDPFNPNLILVIYTDVSGTMYGQYIYVNNVWNDTGSTTSLSTYTFSFTITSGAGDVSFKFSEQYQNLITIFFNNSSIGNYPCVINGVVDFYSITGTQCVTSPYVPLTTDISYASIIGSRMERLEGQDKFIFAFSGYNTLAGAYESNAWIWTMSSTPFDGYNAPTPNVGTKYLLLDNSVSPYSSGVTALKASFIDNSRFVYGAYRYNVSMEQILITVVGTYSGITINSVGTPVENTNHLYPNTSVSPMFTQMPTNKSYILWYYALYNGSNYDIQGCTIRVTSGTSLSSYSSDLMLMPSSAPPLFQVVSSNMLIWSYVISNDVNGTATLFFTNFTNTTYYNKKSTITYVNQVFNSQNLLGIAQNTVSGAQTVQIIPFGGVDENQTGLSAGTYYLQNDGTLTQNVTPFIFGRRINATTIKTANYPTI